MGLVLLAPILARPAGAAYLNTGLGEGTWEHDGHTHQMIWAEWGRSTNGNWSLRLRDSWNAEFAFPGFDGHTLNSGGTTVGDTAGDWFGIGDGEGIPNGDCNVGDGTAVSCHFRFRYETSAGWQMQAGSSWSRVARHWGSSVLGFAW